ncbi:uncharacterized protein LOC127150345 isoform X2 [Cucumis melo]|nr:uncharacterized protein LOC127150345 isoform X2 [Cucumis melo]
MTKTTVLLSALCSFSLEHGEFLLRHDPKNDAVEEQVEIWTDFDFLSEFGSSKTVVDDAEFPVFFGVPAVKIEFRKLEKLPPGEIGRITFFKLLFWLRGLAIVYIFCFNKGSVTLSLGNLIMNRDRGKSTVACALSQSLYKIGKLAYILDGDNVRHDLNRDLGFKAEDRAENIRRVGEVAKLFANAGVICIASVISPYRRDRDARRAILSDGYFIEVFMDVPLEVCEARDAKGLYKLAWARKIKG